MKWSEEDICLLIKYNQTMTMSELSIALKRTYNSIKRKMGVLNIKRPPIFKSQATTERNKTKLGRNLSFETLVEIAKLYKSRKEFRNKDLSAYSTARRKNYLDIICNHMTLNQDSLPQLILRNILETLFKMKCLYNTRKIIKPYEIDIFFQEYNLAFEYNGTWWHKNDKVNKKEICKTLNIELITIHEMDKNNYELDIKKQIIDNLQIINERTNSKITTDDVMKTNIESIASSTVDETYIIETVAKYENMSDFILREKRLYNKLCRLELRDKYCNVLKYKHEKFNEESIKFEISKFIYLIDFIEKSRKTYTLIKKRKLEHLLKPLIRKRNNKN